MPIDLARNDRIIRQYQAEQQAAQVPAPEGNLVVDALGRTIGGASEDIGALANAVGAHGLGRGMYRWGANEIAAHPEHAKSFSAAPLTWIAERGIEALPYLIPFGGGAKLGLMAAGKLLGEDALKSGITRYLASSAGIGTAMAPLNVGGNLVYQQQTGQPQSLGHAAIAALPQTLLDTIGGEGGVIRRGVAEGISGADRAAADIANEARLAKIARLRAIPRTMLRIGAEQGAIQGGQSLSQQLLSAPSIQQGYANLTSPQGIDQFMQSIGGGFAGGALFGAGAGAIRMRAASRELAGRVAARQMLQEARTGIPEPSLPVEGESLLDTIHRNLTDAAKYNEMATSVPDEVKPELMARTHDALTQVASAIGQLADISQDPAHLRVAKSAGLVINTLGKHLRDLQDELKNGKISDEDYNQSRDKIIDSQRKVVNKLAEATDKVLPQGTSVGADIAGNPLVDDHGNLLPANEPVAALDENGNLVPANDKVVPENTLETVAAEDAARNEHVSPLVRAVQASTDATAAHAELFSLPKGTPDSIKNVARNQVAEHLSRGIEALREADKTTPNVVDVQDLDNKLQRIQDQRAAIAEAHEMGNLSKKNSQERHAQLDTQQQKLITDVRKAARAISKARLDGVPRTEAQVREARAKAQAEAQQVTPTKGKQNGKRIRSERVNNDNATGTVLPENTVDVQPGTETVKPTKEATVKARREAAKRMQQTAEQAAETANTKPVVEKIDKTEPAVTEVESKAYTEAAANIKSALDELPKDVSESHPVLVRGASRLVEAVNAIETAKADKSSPETIDHLERVAREVYRGLPSDFRDADKRTMEIQLLSNHPDTLARLLHPTNLDAAAHAEGASISRISRVIGSLGSDWKGTDEANEIVEKSHVLTQKLSDLRNANERGESKQSIAKLRRQVIKAYKDIPQDFSSKTEPEMYKALGTTREAVQSSQIGEAGRAEKSATDDESEGVVKDENGQPKLFYHGTDADFDTVKKGLRGGIYFTSAKDDVFLAGRKNIIKAHIVAKNPMTLADMKQHIDDFEKELPKNDAKDEFINYIKKDKPEAYFHLPKGFWKVATKLGFDSVHADQNHLVNDWYIVKSADQVQEQTGNVTEQSARGNDARLNAAPTSQETVQAESGNVGAASPEDVGQVASTSERTGTSGSTETIEPERQETSNAKTQRTQAITDEEIDRHLDEMDGFSTNRKPESWSSYSALESQTKPEIGEAIRRARAGIKKLTETRRLEILRTLRENPNIVNVHGRLMWAADAPEEMINDDISHTDPGTSDIAYWSGRINHEHVASDDFQKIVKGFSDAVKRGDAAGIYNGLRDMLQNHKELTPILNWARQAFKQVEVTYQDTVEKDRAGRERHGQYDPKTDKITIFRGGIHPIVLLHEAVHAMTYKAMLEAKSILDRGHVANARERNLITAYQKIIDVYQQFHGELPKTQLVDVSMKNPYEFIAQSMADPDFRALLMTKPKVNLWSRLVDGIRQFLGMAPSHTRPLQDLFTAAQALSYNSAGSSYAPAGMRELFYTSAGPRKIAEARDAMNSVSMLDKFGSIGNAKLRKIILGLNTRHHIQERFGRVLRGVDQISAANDKQEALATKLNNDIGRFSDRHLQWLSRNKQIATKLWTALDLHSQFRLSHEQVYDILKGKMTFDEMRDGHALAASQQGRSARGILKRIDYLGKANFDRMVTALKDVGWNEHPDTNIKNMASWKANDWGHYIFQLSREDAERSYDSIIRQIAYRALRDRAVFAMPLEDVVHRVETTPDVSDYVRSGIRQAKEVREEQLAAPYVPSYRRGNYFVSIRTASQGDNDPSQVLYFQRVSSPAEAKAIYDQLSKTTHFNNAEVTTSYGEIERLKLHSDEGGTVLHIARALVDQLTADNMAHRLDMSDDQIKAMQDAAFQAAMRLMPETSALKSYLHREGVPGWEPDQQFEGFVNHLVRSNYRFANDKFVADIEDGLNDMRQNVRELQDPQLYAEDEAAMAHRQAIATSGVKPIDAIRAAEVMAELKQRFVNATKPVDTPFIDTLRSFAYNWQLALSPGYTVMNLTQPYALTIPTLGARYGFIKATGALIGGYEDSMRVLKAMLKDGYSKPVVTEDIMERLRQSKAIPEHDLNAIQAMLESGKVEFSLAKEAGQVSQGAEKRARIMRFLSSSAHYVEAINRISSGLAAARLERERILGRSSRELTDTEIQKIHQTALWAIDTTQFNYSRMNQPRLLGKHGILGEMTPLFTLFMNYSVNVMEKYARLMRNAFDKEAVNVEERKEARRALAGMLLTTASIAGIGGLPLMSAVYAGVNMISPGDDDSDAMLRAWLSHAFGKEVGDIMYNGLPAAFGLDLQSRVGQQDIFPYTRTLFSDKPLSDMSATQFLSSISAALGTGIGIGNMVPNAYNWVANGDNSAADAFIRGMPAAIRGLATAVHGYYDYQGNPIPGSGGIGAKLLEAGGFTPAVREDQLLLSYATHDKQMRQRRDAQYIRRNWVHAIVDGDAAEVKEWQTKAENFVKNNPEQRSLIRGIPQAVKSMEIKRSLMRVSGTGVALTPQQAYYEKQLIESLYLQ